MEQKDGEGKVDLLELIVSGVKGQNLMVAVPNLQSLFAQPKSSGIILVVDFLLRLIQLFRQPVNR